VLTSLAAGMGTLVLGIWPFGMAVYAPLPGGNPTGLLGFLPQADPVTSLVGKLTEAAETYQGLTINAFNLWRNPWSGLGDTITWGCDAPSAACMDGAGVAFSIGSTLVTWQAMGAVLFGVAALVALWQIARRDDPVGLLTGSLLLAVAFFAFPTRVHERYLFPALALAAPLVLRGGRWILLYGLLTLSSFANMYWVYTADWSFVQDQVINPGVDGLPMQRDSFLDGTLFTDRGIYALSWVVVVIAVTLTARAAVVAWTARSPEPMRRPESEALPAGAGIEPAMAAAPMLPESGWIPRVRAWLRPDRADPYLREPMRRLDRLDLALVIGFVLFALVFRLWRLDTPRSMHFDEVYHARSATEWLADWQEGWTRDTYEWTHPHLAKYLIAAGIVAADPNKLVDEVALDAPAAALAVAPQRTERGRPASIAFTAADDTITARELPAGAVAASWRAPGMVTSLAYDEDNERLLVGTADAGEAYAFALADFVTRRGERAPPPGAAPIATGLAAVSQIVVPQGESVILIRGPDGIVLVERASGAELGRSELVAGGVGYLPANGDDPALVVATDPRRGALAVLDGDSLREDRTESLPAPPAGPLVVRGRGDGAHVYVPVGALPGGEEHPAVEGGLTVFDERGELIDTAPLPGAPRLVGWQHVANIVYVAGIDASSGEAAVWTIQPIGNGDPQSAGFAAFDTTPLPGEPLALAFDISDHRQDDDHGRLLVTTAADGGGALVGVDAGSNAFAWRISGVVFGSVLVGLVYLLAATMFRRRRIAVLAAAFVAVDGMSYVMSRISMNDIFVATFIAAAYLVFWQVWSGRWARSAWWAIPLVGVLIGLAAATKWVGIYALAGLWVLVLARSHLGRFALVAGVAFVTVVAGIGAPWPFVVVCLAALLVALLAVWARPVRLSSADLLAIAPTALVLSGVGLAFALVFNQVEGGGTADNSVELAFAVLARGAQVGWPAWLMVGIAAALLLARAALSIARPESDRRWHLPAEMGGFAWPWVGASLAVIPLVVYFLAYVPYLQLGHGIAGPDAGPGYGWSLEELHAQMFGYHFGLQAGHAASSPWWSWPLDLKPVWFYGHDFDGRTIGVIYNGGNPILFWAGVPAIVICGILAWKRRSPALVLVVVAFAFQFLPWTRIERATFHYHYFTAVLFAMVAVAYLVDEGLRSWSWRPLSVAFLVAAAIAGVLVFPMGSALAMPDWYINAARALPPWNYGFQFPNPPQGDRAELLSVDIAKLALGGLVALLAASFALFGRDRWRGGPTAARPEPPDLSPA
jgi:4-amino-4-deoxy-L-arabinose transferase-like glycosyltransferase